MKRGSHLICGLFLIMAGLCLAESASAAKANAPIAALNVTEVRQDGVSQCDQGSWSFKLSWKPAIKAETLWVKYIVAADKCTGHTYECTAERCTAQISGCSIKMKATVASVAADAGKKIGTRAGGIMRPLNCQ